MGEKIICCNCSELFDSADVTTVSGSIYCTDCYDELFANCDSCGRTIEKDNAYYPESGSKCLCQKCYNDQYFSCYECSSETSTDNSYELSGNYYCENCYYDVTVECRECEERCLENDAFYDDNEDAYFCPDCRSDKKHLHSYSYMPRLKYNHLPYERNPLLQGTELEVETEKDIYQGSKELLDFVAPFNQSIYCKTDGSLDNGFEIVTHPTSLMFSHQYFHWYKILNWLKANGFYSYKTGTCGLHIHINKNHLTPIELKKLRLFFKICFRELSAFSKRNGKNSFCEYETSISHREILKERKQEGRYNALNLNTSKPTIEFRIFRGTLNSKRFLASSQFVGAVIEFIKDVGVSHIYYSMSSNLWLEFLTYTKDKNKYQHFTRYTTKKEVKKCA